jgi:dihydrofolate synthase/folylpolyglutamate synthase
MVLDGAHNVEGAVALREYMEEFIDLPLVLVFAAMSDKKIEEVTEILFPLAHTIILTQFPYSRAAGPQEIKQRSGKFQGMVRLEPDVTRAMRYALNAAGKDGAVLVTGSLFLVGEVKKIFPHMFQSPHHSCGF